jgi:hypothetical protein
MPPLAALLLDDAPPTPLLDDAPPTPLLDDDPTLPWELLLLEAPVPEPEEQAGSERIAAPTARATRDRADVRRGALVGLAARLGMGLARDGRRASGYPGSGPERSPRRGLIVGSNVPRTRPLGPKDVRAGSSGGKIHERGSRFARSRRSHP